MRFLLPSMGAVNVAGLAVFVGATDGASSLLIAAAIVLAPEGARVAATFL